MWQFIAIVAIAMICALLVVASMLKHASERREESQREQEQKQQDQAAFSSSSPQIILELSAYASRRQSQLSVAVTQDETGFGAERGTREIILNDLAQIARILPKDGSICSRAGRRMLAQFMLAASVGNHDDSYSVISDSVVDLHATFVALQILATAELPDRFELRDQYIAFAKLAAEGLDADLLKSAIIEITRQARTRNEIIADSSPIDEELRSKWMRVSNGQVTPSHSQDAGMATSVGPMRVLAEYANRRASGMITFIKITEPSRLETSDAYTPSYFILVDIVRILDRLIGDRSNPTKAQMELIRTYCVATDARHLGHLSLAELWEAVEPCRGGQLMGLRFLVDIKHPDRFEVRNLYLSFAAVAGFDMKDELINTLHIIQMFALNAEEQSRIEPTRPEHDYLETLGVKAPFSVEELKHAYHRQVQLWHPDRLSTMAPELQAAATVRLAQINEAYASLSQSVA